MHAPASPTRRRWLLGASSLSLAAVVARPGTARADRPPQPPVDLDTLDLRVDGSRALARRATVLVPKNAAALGPLPVLVLLHGLGETGNERDGIHAWAERYGLASSYARLLRPPVATGLPRMRYLLPERAAQIDRELASDPFKGLVLVCPFTPNVFRMHTQRALDEYAAWIVDVLLPEVRKATPASKDPRHTGLDGCSLGGFVSFEVFLRRPEAFFTCGGVQAAIGRASGARYAARFAQVVRQHGERRFHVESSGADPYREANVAMADALKRENVPHELRVPPGPHNQPWLQEVGTLEMLLWHERQLR